MVIDMVVLPNRNLMRRVHTKELPPTYTIYPSKNENDYLSSLNL